MSGQKTALIPDADLYFRMSAEKKVAEPAFAELYARYAGRVYAYCYRIMGDRDEADDVYQETFIRFYESAQRVEEMTNVPGFLIKIARNLCLNYRRNKKKTVEFDDLQTVFQTKTQDGPEVLQLLTMALDMLPDDYREAFVLREYEGLSYGEIADIIDIPLPTVKIRIFRAKKKLRQFLTPYLADLQS